MMGKPYRISGKDSLGEDAMIEVDEVQYRRWLIKELDGKLTGVNLERYIERKIAEYRHNNKTFKV